MSVQIKMKKQIKLVFNSHLNLHYSLRTGNFAMQTAEGVNTMHTPSIMENAIGNFFNKLGNGAAKAASDLIDDTANSINKGLGDARKIAGKKVNKKI